MGFDWLFVPRVCVILAMVAVPQRTQGPPSPEVGVLQYINLKGGGPRATLIDAFDLNHDVCLPFWGPLDRALGCEPPRRHHGLT